MSGLTMAASAIITMFIVILAITFIAVQQFAPLTMVVIAGVVTWRIMKHMEKK